MVTNNFLMFTNLSFDFMNGHIYGVTEENIKESSKVGGFTHNRRFKELGDVDVIVFPGSAYKSSVSHEIAHRISDRLFEEDDKTWSNNKANGIYTVQLNREDTKNYDGQSWTLRTDYVYDSYGNTVQIRENGDSQVNGDERYAYNEYVYNPNDWIVGTIKRQYIYASDDITKVRETKYSYEKTT